MRRVSKCALAVAGASMLLALAGCERPPGGPTSTAAVAGGGSAAGTIVEVEVTDKGYEPARITAAPGEPITLRITRTTDHTCAKEIVLKDPPLTRALPLGVPVDITILAVKAGEIAFTCGMDMVSGVIDVR